MYPNPSVPLEHRLQARQLDLHRTGQRRNRHMVPRANVEIGDLRLLRVNYGSNYDVLPRLVWCCRGNITDVIFRTLKQQWQLVVGGPRVWRRAPYESWRKRDQ